MTITAITGKVGSGKNLYAIELVQRYALEGRRVAANFNINLAPIQPLWHRITGKPVYQVEQIPGRPCYADVKQLGKGGPREHRSGLLILDEVGPLLNARTWQDKDRQAFIDWLLHSRKLAWDVLLIVQNIGLVDKQIRVAVIESMVTCKRLDRMKLLGLPLPRIHMAVERYGTEPQAPVAQRRFFRGNRYFRCYDTTELVGDVQDGASADAAKEVPAEPAPARRVSRCMDYFEWREWGWGGSPA